MSNVAGIFSYPLPILNNANYPPPTFCLQLNYTVPTEQHFAYLPASKYSHNIDDGWWIGFCGQG